MGKTILIVIKIIDEDESFLKFFSPLAFRITDHKSNLAVMQSFFILSWHIPMVKFNFDPKDGEIRPTIDFPIFDGDITEKQLQCCLTRMAGLLDEIYEPIVYAIENGKVHPKINQT